VAGFPKNLVHVAVLFAERGSQRKSVASAFVTEMPNRNKSEKIIVKNFFFIIVQNQEFVE
jgi:hypothetical protein